MVWVFLVWRENFSNPKTAVTTEEGMEPWTKMASPGKSAFGNSRDGATTQTTQTIIKVFNRWMSEMD